LPEGPCASDSRRILLYWNKTPANRIVFGTRGKVDGPKTDGDFAHVEKAMVALYPALKDAKITHRWGGRIGLTGDFMPRIDQPEPGLWTAHGYSGRGVAMGTAFGLLMGEAIAANRSTSTLPVPVGPAPDMPPKFTHRAGIVGATIWYSLLDRWV
jgi:glycine/D-amino acid oxidase-like deaminating enzyme